MNGLRSLKSPLMNMTRLPKMINDFVEMIEGLGPNPFKGF